jgi:hypothetical protein
MHRVEGPEFAHVLIAGADEGVLPASYAAEWEEQVRERCLPHVASSDAPDTLTITSHGMLSPCICDLKV